MIIGRNCGKWQFLYLPNIRTGNYVDSRTKQIVKQNVAAFYWSLAAGTAYNFHALEQACLRHFTGGFYWHYWKHAPFYFYCSCKGTGRVLKFFCSILFIS